MFRGRRSGNASALLPITRQIDRLSQGAGTCWSRSAPSGWRRGVHGHASEGLVGLDTGNSEFAAAAVRFDFKRNFLTFGQARDASALKGRDVHEHIVSTSVWLNEPVALCRIEEFNDTRLHKIYL